MPMNQATRETLHEAYRLIKAGDQDSARALIKPVLAARRDNIDAWWLAAHAAATPHDRRLALGQVLRIDPDHRPARILLDRLDAENPHEIEDLAKDLPLPPPGRKRGTADQPLVQNRWVWNVVMLFGCLGISFGSMALISGVLGLTWFDNTVNRVGKAVHLSNDKQGAGGQLGTVQGGSPAMPYEIPITKRVGVAPSSNTPTLGTLKKDEAHIYTFFGDAGQEVDALLQFAVAGDAHYVVELWDSGYNRLAYGTGASNSGTVTLIYTLPRSGQYALVIIGRPNGPRGDYALGLDVLD